MSYSVTGYNQMFNHVLLNGEFDDRLTNGAGIHLFHILLQKCNDLIRGVNASKIRCLISQKWLALLTRAVLKKQTFLYFY